MRRNGGIIGSKQDPSLADAKGIWDIHDQTIYRKTGTFPRIGSIGNVTLNGSTSPQSISEGASLTFVASTSGIPDGETLDWQVYSVAGTLTSADFTGAIANLSGTVTVGSNQAQVTGGLTLSGGTENESFRVQFRPSNSGQDWSLGNSPVCTIVDVTLTFYSGSATTDSNVVYENDSQFFYRNTMTSTSSGNTDGFVWKEFLDHMPTAGASVQWKDVGSNYIALLSGATATGQFLYALKNRNTLTGSYNDSKGRVWRVWKGCVNGGGWSSYTSAGGNTGGVNPSTSSSEVAYMGNYATTGGCTCSGGTSDFIWRPMIFNANAGSGGLSGTCGKGSRTIEITITL